MRPWFTIAWTVDGWSGTGATGSGGTRLATASGQRSAKPWRESALPFKGSSARRTALYSRHLIVTGEDAPPWRAML
jgi:hypothetical protein